MIPLLSKVSFCFQKVAQFDQNRFPQNLEEKDGIVVWMECPSVPWLSMHSHQVWRLIPPTLSDDVMNSSVRHIGSAKLLLLVRRY
jgi:hypothetical protein